MTAFDGWVHDRAGAGGMLYAEALLGLGCTAVFPLALGSIRARSKRADEVAVVSSSSP